MGRAYETVATTFDLNDVHVSLQEPILVSPDLLIKDHPAKISLSSLDRQAPSLYMKTLLLYNNHVLGSGNENIFNKLKSALQQVLVLHFPLAGRLKKEDDTGNMGIECNSKGVPLVEASIKSDEINFPKAYEFHKSKLEDKFFYKLESSSDIPLITIQVTQFSSGGFVLGIGWRHEVFDAYGFGCFLRAWADIARGERLCSIPRPQYGRQILQPTPGLANYSDWRTQVDEQYVGIPMHTFSLSSTECAVTDTATPPNVTKIYPFTKPIISSLKRKAMEGGFLTTCSTFDVVVSHAWRARVKAFGMLESERALLSFPVNVRSRTNPPLPEHYIGNAFVTTSSNCSVGDLLSQPFHATVREIQKAKAMVGERYVASAVMFVEEEIRKGTYPSARETTMVADSINFGFEQLDFGWGATTFMAPFLPSILGAVILVVRTGGLEEEGGVSLSLGLPPLVMAKFEEHLLHI